MKGEEEQVRKAAEEIGKQIADDQNYNAEFGAIAKEIFETGKIPKEALGFSDDRIEAIYGQAYRLYNTGQYMDASHLFRLLMILDATEPKYYIGLAACLHMLKDFSNAAQVYITCSVIDPTSPVPFFHASDCYIQLRDRPSAIFMLEMAVQRAGEKPEYQVLKERALLTISNLKKELAQMGAHSSS